MKEPESQAPVLFVLALIVAGYILLICLGVIGFPPRWVPTGDGPIF